MHPKMNDKCGLFNFHLLTLNITSFLRESPSLLYVITSSIVAVNRTIPRSDVLTRKYLFPNPSPSSAILAKRRFFLLTKISYLHLNFVSAVLCHFPFYSFHFCATALLFLFTFSLHLSLNKHWHQGCRYDFPNKGAISLIHRSLRLVTIRHRDDLNPRGGFGVGGLGSAPFF